MGSIYVNFTSTTTRQAHLVSRLTRIRVPFPCSTSHTKYRHAFMIQDLLVDQLAASRTNWPGKCLQIHRSAPEELLL